jgi:hypothetical protein
VRGPAWGGGMGLTQEKQYCFLFIQQNKIDLNWFDPKMVLSLSKNSK